MGNAGDLQDLLNKSTLRIWVEHLVIGASPAWIFLIIFAIGWYHENRELVSEILKMINF